MTASIAALLQPIKDRLEPALFHAPYRADGRRVVQANHHPQIMPYVLSSESIPDIATFIAAAPTDQARLIAAVEAVNQLADHFDELASLTSYSQPSAVTEAHLEAASMIRAALTSVLESAA